MLLWLCSVMASSDRLKNLQGCTVYQGHGRFVAEKKVAVNGCELTADRIFINVGARATISPIPGLDQVPYLTNSSMMDIDFLPSHLVILGGSYVGLEFAQVYRRFGSKVTVIEFGPRLISREDDDVSQAVAGFLEEEGINVRVNSEIVSVEKQDNSIVAKIQSTGTVSHIAGTHLLVATGRRPNTDDLGLDKAGIAINARGHIVVDDELRHEHFRYLGNRRLQRFEARSRTRLGMISRSWQRISWTMIGDG